MDYFHLAKCKHSRKQNKERKFIFYLAYHKRIKEVLACFNAKMRETGSNSNSSYEKFASIMFSREKVLECQ